MESRFLLVLAVGICLNLAVEVSCKVDTLYNILATRHVNGGGDACALPQANYNVRYPFALGSIPELAHLKFRPGVNPLNHTVLSLNV